MKNLKHLLKGSITDYDPFVGKNSQGVEYAMTPVFSPLKRQLVNALSHDEAGDMMHASWIAMLWAAACKADGIDVTSKFVVFSDENLAAVAYNNYMVALQHAIEAANSTGNSTLVYQQLDGLRYDVALTLPPRGRRIGPRIYPS